MYRIGEVARLAHVTQRLLRHYDDIGLLVPSGRSEAGYRLYRRTDLERLQQILFFRVLQFPPRGDPEARGRPALRPAGSPATPAQPAGSEVC